MLSEYHVSVKAALTRGSEMLMLHSEHSPDLPGGRIESGETPIAALIRELSEELPGICDIEIGELVGWHLYEAYQSEGKDLIVMIFHVQANLPQLIRLSEEHESFEWLPLAKAKEVLSGFDICWNRSF